MTRQEFERTITKIREYHEKTGNNGFIIEGIYYCHKYGHQIPDDFISIVLGCLVEYRENVYNLIDRSETRKLLIECDKLLGKIPLPREDNKTTLDKCFGINHKKMQQVFSDKPDYIEMVNHLRLLFGLNIKDAVHVTWRQIGHYFKHKEDTIYQEYVRAFPETEFCKYLSEYGKFRGSDTLQQLLDPYPPKLQSYIKHRQTVYPK